MLEAYKVRKILEIICLLIVLGAFLGACTFSGKEKTSQMTYVGIGITALDIVEISHAVHVIASADDKVHVTYFDNEKKHYSFHEAGGKLTIAYDDQLPWYMRIFNFDMKTDEALTVAVPQRTINALNAKTVNGNITATSVELTGALTFRTTNGQMTLEAVRVNGGISMSSTNGGIRIKDTLATGDISTSLTNGSIMMQDTKAMGACDFAGTNGLLEARDVTADSIQMKTTNGSISLIRAKVDKSLVCQTVNGSITGDVVAKKSDFQIDSHTVNGSSNLQNQQEGGKKMKITTVNGKINIAFTE